MTNEEMLPLMQASYPRESILRIIGIEETGEDTYEVTVITRGVTLTNTRINQTGKTKGGKLVLPYPKVEEKSDDYEDEVGHWILRT